MDRRKHYTQMNADEMVIVQSAVRNLGKVQVTPYVKQRMAMRSIENVDIARALVQGDVIEVHNNKRTEVRVLVRAVSRGRWCNVVVSLTTKTVITCYWNSLDDTHATLDKSQYRWVVDLKTVV